MKIQNNLSKPVWVVFLKQLEFRKLLGVASSYDSLRVMLREIRRDYKDEKIEIIKIGGKK